ncbi:MAG TPA: peptidoglycan bridge formation glycyltransferase FemA/FemB family protein [Aggregatilineales bacterium]|nr:peptidoglycan bridge formation glycyltransferase FemA/FemB family protein [Anaerolineales bacterium]HRE48492.1 peptidoglycan bridge formation glycyltransferase FemA/FemB family protein [Aggregatilineales bacterium]
MTYRMLPYSGSDWNGLILRLPHSHILQSAEWGAFKQITGWKAARYVLYDAAHQISGAAQVLTRHVGPLAMMYAPRAPLVSHTDHAAFEALLVGLERIARRQPTVQIKIDPDVVIGRGVPGEADATEDANGLALCATLRRRGWRFSAEQVQFRNTILIDLTHSEDDLLKAMGSGKRRKVGYGARHGVTIRAATLDDLPLLYRLYAETGSRNGFTTRPYEYYLSEWGMLMRAGMAHALIAEVNGQPVAHVILFLFGETCLYFTGASVSDNEVRKLMPADMLQWEAMRYAKGRGCTVYDLWGAPNEFAEGDSMWGVFGFKRDFGGVITRHMGAWDYAPYPALYTLYTRIMPRLLNAMRRRG